jgi:hypothetical protein
MGEQARSRLKGGFVNVRPVRGSANLAAGSIPTLTRRVLALAVLCACAGGEPIRA